MDENEFTLLENKHRKEKKELQAQIQSLKKALKGDKTRKREITAEICRLELELESRQNEEITALSNSEVIPQSDSSELDLGKLKISKAQKRRDKKAQQEKERAESIQIQEKENSNGPRNVEILTITAKLKEKNLKIFPIPSDGDCLYQAVIHQLTSTEKDIPSVSELRKTTADHMRNSKEDFIPFMSNPETFDMLTQDEFEEYCSKVENTKVWGGQLEIRAMSNSLKCPIHVVQASGPDTIKQGDEFNSKPIVISYHRHMYRLGEHYNSTQPFVEGSDESES